VRADDDDFASLVVAQQFQLLNDAGSVVAELGSTTIGASSAADLQMNHLDATTTNSSLAWTQSPIAGQQSVELRGPRPLAGNVTPYVRLETNGIAQMVSAGLPGPTTTNVLVSSTDGYSMVDQQRSAFVQSNFPGVGQASGTDNVTDVYYHRTGTTFSRVGHGDFSGGGGSFVEKAYVGVNGATAAVIGESEAIMRSGSGTGEYVQATGGNINVGPIGRLTLNGRTGYLPLGVQQSVLPASLTIGYRGFLMTGINVNGAIGDQYVITATCRVLCSAAGGAFLFEYQGFGGGAGVSAQRGVATQWAVNHDATISATWLFTQTVPGVIGWTIVGGQTGGTWVLVAPDSWFTVQHYGIR
jgi:hypothetical protein